MKKKERLALLMGILCQWSRKKQFFTTTHLLNYCNSELFIHKNITLRTFERYINELTEKGFIKLYKVTNPPQRYKTSKYVWLCKYIKFYNDDKPVYNAPIISEKRSLNINEGNEVVSESFSKISDFKDQKKQETTSYFSDNEKKELSEFNLYKIAKNREKLYNRGLDRIYKDDKIINYLLSDNVRIDEIKNLNKYYSHLKKNFAKYSELQNQKLPKKINYQDLVNLNSSFDVLDKKIVAFTEKIVAFDLEISDIYYNIFLKNNINKLDLNKQHKQKTNNVVTDYVEKINNIPKDIYFKINHGRMQKELANLKQFNPDDESIQSMSYTDYLENCLNSDKIHVKN